MSSVSTKTANIPKSTPLKHLYTTFPIDPNADVNRCSCLLVKDLMGVSLCILYYLLLRQSMH